MASRRCSRRTASTGCKGGGQFTGPNTIAVEGAEDVAFKSAVIATGSFPVRPPIPGIDAPRCVDSTGLLAQTEVPRRLLILGGGIIGCEFASIFNRFGTEVTIVEMLPTLIASEDEDAAKELEKAFKKRGIALHLGKECRQVDDHGSHLTVHFGEGETVDCRPDARLGRAVPPSSTGSASRGSGRHVRSRRASEPTTIGARTCRTSTRRGTSRATGSWRTPGFREGEIAAENAMGHEATMGDPAVPRPIYTDPEIAGWA